MKSTEAHSRFLLGAFGRIDRELHFGVSLPNARNELRESASVFATCSPPTRNAAAAQSRRSQRVAVEECHGWRSSRRLAIPCWDHQIPMSGDVKKLPD